MAVELITEVYEAVDGWPGAIGVGFLMPDVHDLPAQDEWLCQCNYTSIGSICTKCGLPRWAVDVGFSRGNPLRASMRYA